MTAVARTVNESSLLPGGPAGWHTGLDQSRGGMARAAARTRAKVSSLTSLGWWRLLTVNAEGRVRSR